MLSVLYTLLILKWDISPRAIRFMHRQSQLLQSLLCTNGSNIPSRSRSLHRIAGMREDTHCALLSWDIIYLIHKYLHDSFSLVLQDIGPIGPDRNWKGIGISILVIALVLSLIGLSIVLLSKGETPHRSTYQNDKRNIFRF